jgi:hypothetical protein
MKSTTLLLLVLILTMVSCQPIIHLGKRKISHLTNREIARLADAAVDLFCYTVSVGRAFPGPMPGHANVILYRVEPTERVRRGIVMSERSTHQVENTAANAIVLHLHGLVTYGPWDLDVAAAMSDYGYDEVKWAEGQGMLAELLSAEAPAQNTLAAARSWYEEAAKAARRALATQPQALAKLGLVGMRCE